MPERADVSNGNREPVTRPTLCACSVAAHWERLTKAAQTTANGANRLQKMMVLVQQKFSEAELVAAGLGHLAGSPGTGPKHTALSESSAVNAYSV